MVKVRAVMRTQLCSTLWTTVRNLAFILSERGTMGESQDQCYLKTKEPRVYRVYIWSSRNHAMGGTGKSLLSEGSNFCSGVLLQA